MIGETIDGHDLDMLVFGDEHPDKAKIWIIARQHPGETMAEWFVDGLMKRLVDRCVSVFHCVFYCVRYYGLCRCQLPAACSPPTPVSASFGTLLSCTCMTSVQRRWFGRQYVFHYQVALHCIPEEDDHARRRR